MQNKSLKNKDNVEISDEIKEFLRKQKLELESKKEDTVSLDELRQCYEEVLPEERKAFVNDFKSLFSQIYYNKDKESQSNENR